MPPFPRPILEILVTRGNPSRGRGFEIAHFLRHRDSIRSISSFDRFVRSLKEGEIWVRRRYPEAKLTVQRADRTGRLVALAFVCPQSALVRSCNRSPRPQKRARRRHPGVRTKGGLP